jgi:diguanylate cyclase (GGDEF)-like protein/PAS domain S-box-containing protein
MAGEVAQGPGSRLRILHLEDDAGDSELVGSLLLKAGLECELVRVDTQAGFEAALASGDFQLILSDYSLPGFDGHGALGLARSRRPELPFLFVSGTIGEDRAVEGLKDGAIDFVLKDRPQRLAQAVRRALAEAEARTGRRRAEEALRSSEERYALAAQGANDGLWDWDLVADVLYLSPRWKSMLGWSDAEVGDAPREWLDRVHAEDIPGLKARLESHVSGQSDHFECEYRIEHRDGGYRWMLARALAVRDAAGRPVRMAGSQTDITQRKAAEEQLQHDALHDSLTGLPNRASFMDRLAMLMKRSSRWAADHGYAVLFLDLDRFKLVNDGLGHVIGDQLLVSFARRLEGCLRHGDTVARLGGDEFALLLDGSGSVTEATRAAERVHRALEAPFHLEGHEVFESASIGIALSVTGYERPQDIIRDADTAMYRAKALGGGRHAVFDQAMHARAVKALQLENELRRAVERRDFVLHYQPVVSLAEGRVVSFEALVRWKHPEKGLVMPSHFIGLAEETGLIVPLGSWVLREACRQMSDWARLTPAGPLVSVNLSARQLAQPGFVGELKELVRATGLRAGALGVEITESALVEGGDIRGALMDLRGLGVPLMLDDFGTGYSSLSYLLRFPIDVIKVDACFVSGMERDLEKLEIVRSILAIAHSMGKRVVAEGVENVQQAAVLRSLRCDYGQGFHWAPPLEASAVTAML